MTLLLPEGNTAKGKILSWHGHAVHADDPLSAWQGLLASRGLAESDSFFSPRLSDLPDPYAMKDMEQAANRVVQAITGKENIHVFGDFDADGVNGTAILVQALTAADARVSYSIPHRSDDGHGIGVEPVREVMQRGVRLGISVDTGTTCFEACAAAANGGMDMIVSDHHLPGSSLPDAYAVLNPAREDCGFADRQLCGTGVAFFLLMAVWRGLREQGRQPEFDLKSLLDRVAIATVADVMDLIGINRILVYHGLKQMNEYPSLGVKALMQVARVKKAVTVETIGFQLAPRINAAGRMQRGEVAMQLLSCSEEQQAYALAQALDEANKHRRQVEADVYKQAEAKLAMADTLAVYDPSWHAGVVGLAAGRLSRKHGKPAAVGFVTPDGLIRISLRGCPGFHVGKLLDACSMYLEGFGGHAGAGGGTVKDGHWDDFVTAFAQAVNQQADTAGQGGVELVDGVLGLGALHGGLAERLARFEPTGRGNPPCCWLLRHVHITGRRDLKGGVVRLKLGDGVRHADAIVFGGKALDDYIQPGQLVSLVGQLQQDDWRGNGAVQFVVSDAILESDVAG